MLYSSSLHNDFLLPASHILSEYLAGEPSYAGSKQADILIGFCLCSLIVEFIADEGFIILVLSSLI
jgi:hypothetical protein